MTHESVKQFIWLSRYIHSSVFSPGGMLMILILLGFIPLTWISILAGVATPIVSGFLSGIINGIEKANTELERNY